MIGTFVDRIKGWQIICDVCGLGPLGHVSGEEDFQPEGYLEFYCIEHTPIIEPEPDPIEE
jgi:hypothetical protein